MKTLITGFEPYWDYPENSSWVVAKEVAARGVAGVEIACELMPVSYERVAGALREAVSKHHPDVVIMLGQSGGSDKVKLERVALNMMDSKLPDNDGFTPDEEPINYDAPVALFTNMPIKSLCATVEEQGIPVKISNSCGLYVCNRLYYEALMICKEQPQMQAIFVHLPFYNGHPSAKHGKPTMPLSQMVRAIEIIIEEHYEKNRKV
jgi:pyroglutamyl-peptidase